PRLPTAIRQALQEKSLRTERARIDEQLRQNQKMESIARLAGGVAHDFNNLLEIVIGYSDLLLHELPDGSKQIKAAEEIKNAGVRAASLTRQLLAFSRKQVMVPHVIDLNSTVKEMDRMLRRVIGEQIELETKYGGNLW